MCNLAILVVAAADAFIAATRMQAINRPYRSSLGIQNQSNETQFVSHSLASLGSIYMRHITLEVDRDPVPRIC
jgi:hypothetical protein